MKIVDMKCNRIVTPLGFAMEHPRLSWVTEGEEATTQLGCQVVVAEDEDFVHIVHDSGVRKDVDGIAYTLPIELKNYTRYFWKVRVITEIGEVISPVTWFETAKEADAWKGKWITPDWEDKKVHPLLRKEFGLAKEIASARLYVCGLGLYEVYMNGKRVGEEYLTPYCNSYDHWLQYQTFDVTSYLEQGDNAIGAMLGNGWYKGRFCFNGKKEGIYGDQFAFLCELVIRFTDGSQELIRSDESWKAAPSEVVESNIYDGEIQDANLKKKDWSKHTFKEEGWSKVVPIDIDDKRLEERLSLPVKIKEERKPQRIIQNQKGETILDMGQNMVGWLRFKVHAPKDSRIHLFFGEELQDGCFYNENLRSAKEEFTYISDGEAAEVQPHFTFYGFRYVKIEGWTGEVKAEDFTGCVVYSDLEQTGTIETSNPMVNRLILNALWGQKGNFLDVPTDCPQRDERMGWTGDAQMFSGTACYNMDSDAFFHKYLHDLAKEQLSNDGVVPHVVPSFRWVDQHTEHRVAGGSSAWSEAATVIPWNLYLHYGDKEILKKQLTSMRAYVDSIRRKDDGSRLWNTGFHFGDWLALDGKGDLSSFGGTPTDLISTAYYAYSAGLVAKAAEVLGEEQVKEEYQKLSDEVKTAFCEEFISPRGKMVSDTQTAYILPLFMDLVPKEYRNRILKDLVKNLKENNYYLKTGFVGTPYLCRVLSENGYNDIAYRLLLNEEFPSWLYEVKLGATTIWERWNSLRPDGKFSELGMNSLNHYTYGSIVEWMFRNMCGIQPLEEYPGFRRIRLAPQPNQKINFAKAKLNTAAGLYESGWKYEGEKLIYNFRIPFAAQAELVLKQVPAEDVVINGTALTQSKFDYHMNGEELLVLLGSGRYEVSHTVQVVVAE